MAKHRCSRKYPSTLLSNLDFGDIVSRDVLDDLTQIGDLPIGHEHAVRPHARVLLQRKRSPLWRPDEVVRMVQRGIEQHTLHMSG
jgi:hypothetical protein